MIEIFEQVDKERKQVFKPAERPWEEFVQLQTTVKWHFEQHKKIKRRWKITGWTIGIVVVSLGVLALFSYLIATYLTEVRQ